MTDILVVGAGPAGCAAAMTARMRDKSVTVCYAGDGALALVKRADNYPGFPHADGKALLGAFRAQALEMGAVLTHALVSRIMPMGDTFSVLAGQDVLEARGVILCTGKARKALLDNEERLVGSGVSYCATCDGMLYKGREIAVIGTDEQSVREANFLATLARVTYYSEKKHDLSKLSGDIRVSGEKPLAIVGDQKAEGVRTDAGERAADGVFILRPSVSLSLLMPELTLENGDIRVDKDLQTVVPRVFAAGDVSGEPLQIAKAVGEGNRAALALAKLLG